MAAHRRRPGHRPVPARRVGEVQPRQARGALRRVRDEEGVDQDAREAGVRRPDRCRPGPTRRDAHDGDGDGGGVQDGQPAHGRVQRPVPGVHGTGDGAV